MLSTLIDLLMFASKAVILLVIILLLLAGILALVSKGKEKLKGRLLIKHLNEEFDDIQTQLSSEILSKKQFKQFLKEKKSADKEREKSAGEETKIYVITFDGDIKASAVTLLREEINALLSIAKPHDEVIVRLESSGGMVHAYGLAAAQLLRVRQQGIRLTVTVDKVAASGGYLMAAVAHKILAAPFAIIGSIGVIVQLPNFHRLLEEKNIDFEQITAGKFKRTLTLFGKNTDEGRQKLHDEIEEIHAFFKQIIQEHRPQLDIEKIATGEHWLAKYAQSLQLVDELKTSDDYILEKCKNHAVYEIRYEIKKSLGERLTATAHAIKQTLFATVTY